MAEPTAIRDKKNQVIATLRIWMAQINLLPGSVRVRTSVLHGAFVGALEPTNPELAQHARQLFNRWTWSEMLLREFPQYRRYRSGKQRGLWMSYAPVPARTLETEEYCYRACRTCGHPMLRVRGSLKAQPKLTLDLIAQRDARKSKKTRATPRDYARSLLPVIQELQKQGFNTLYVLARELRHRGFSGVNGGVLTPTSVRRILMLSGQA